MTPFRSPRPAALFTALICGAGALAAGAPPVAGAALPSAAAPAAGADTNLLLNPGAQTGAVSAQGWDSVTIPGWQVASGLPTVVRYGTPGFPVPPSGGRPCQAGTCSLAAPGAPRGCGNWSGCGQRRARR